jgi:WD40 repeat protein
MRAGTGRLLPSSLPGPDDATHLLAFDNTGGRVVAGCDSNEIAFVFDAQTGREVARLDGLSHVTWLGFLSRDVLLAARIRHMHNYEAVPGQCEQLSLRRGHREVLFSDDSTRCAAVSPDGSVVAIGTGNGVALHDVRKKRLLRRLESAVAGQATHVTFSETGRYVAAAQTNDPGHGPWVVLVWDVEEGRRYRTFEVASDWFGGLAFCRDTLTLAVATWQDVILFHQSRGEDSVGTYPLEERCTALRFPSGPQTMEALLHDGRIVRFRTGSGQVVRRGPGPAGRALGYAVPSRDWSRFAAAMEGGTFVWEA